MVKHICIRCGYETNKKDSILKHYSKKNVCKPKLSDTPIEECKQKLIKGDTDSIICDNCNKEFSTHGSMIRHSKICNSIIAKQIKRFSKDISFINNKESDIEDFCEGDDEIICD